MGEPVDAYEAYCNGRWLLEAREYRQAVIALERAKKLEPDKASIREASAGRTSPRGRTGGRPTSSARPSTSTRPTATPTTASPARSRGSAISARRHFTLARLFGTGLEQPGT